MKRHSGASGLSIKDSLDTVIRSLKGPTTEDEIIDQVAFLKGKSFPRKSVVQQLQEKVAESIVYLDERTVAPLGALLPGTRFRINIFGAPEGIVLPMALSPFSLSFKPQKIFFEDPTGVFISFGLMKKNKRWKDQEDLLEILWDRESYAFDLKEWFSKNGIRSEDSVLVTVLECETRMVFRLEHEPFEKRREEEISRKNQELLQGVQRFMEETREESVLVREAVLTAYLRLRDPKGYPGDNWVFLLAEDERMTCDGFFIEMS